MARKGPQKFVPTVDRLVKSQERIAGYIVKEQATYTQAAKKLGLRGEAELKKYLYGGQKTVIKNFRRNASFRKLFRASGNVVEKEVTTYITIKGKKVPQRRKEKRFSLTGPIAGVEPYVPDVEASKAKVGSEYYAPPEEERQYRRFQQSIRQGYELPRLGMELEWRKYTSRYDLPISIEEIKELYADGELTKRQVTSILTHWHAIYSDMSDDWYEGMVDEFEAFDEFNEEAA